MAVYASIDIASMGTLCSAADIAVDDMPHDAYGYRTFLSPVNVDSSPSAGITKVSSWLEGEIPGLKRRLALAQANEAQKPGRQFVVQIDETQLSTVPPSQATANGKALAQKLRDANGTIDPAVLAELTKNQNDPYFAAGFAGELTPAKLAQIVYATSQQGKQSGAPAGDPYKTWFKQYQGSASDPKESTMDTSSPPASTATSPQQAGPMLCDFVPKDAVVSVLTSPDVTFPASSATTQACAACSPAMRPALPSPELSALRRRIARGRADNSTHKSIRGGRRVACASAGRRPGRPAAGRSATGTEAPADG